jgi:DNA repair protein RadC
MIHGADNGARSLLFRSLRFSASRCRGRLPAADAGEVLHAAQRLLAQQLKGREVLSSPQVVREFLRVKLGALEHEVFAVMMLDA